MPQRQRALPPEHLSIPIPPIPRDNTVVKTSDSAREASCRLRNDKRWNFHKDEIRRIYIEEDRTLQVTMRMIEEKYGFKASPRKWKMKLKEWNFEKYFPSAVMSFAVAKREKRKKEEGKDTIFYHGNSLIPPEKIEHFKRRKMSNKARMASPDPDAPDEPPQLTCTTIGTPRDISYSTPGPERSPSPTSEDVTTTLADYRTTTGNQGPTGQQSVTPKMEQSVTPVTEQSVKPMGKHFAPQMREQSMPHYQPPAMGYAPRGQDGDEDADGDVTTPAPPSYTDELPALSPLRPPSSPNSSSNLQELSQSPPSTSQDHNTLPQMKYLTINPVLLDVNHVGDDTISSNDDQMVYQMDRRGSSVQPTDIQKVSGKETSTEPSDSIIHGVVIDFPRIASRLSTFDIAGQTSYLRGSDDMLPPIGDNADERALDGSLATFEEKMDLAQTYRESGSLRNAESAYLQALVEYSEIACAEGKIARHIPEFLLFFKSLENTGPEHNLHQSIFICRWLLVTCEKELGQGPETIRTMHALAGLRLRSKRLFDAEDLYTKSFSGFERLGLVKERLECQRSLGVLLFSVGRLDKAVRMLVSTLCEYMTGDTLEGLGRGDEVCEVLTALSDAFIKTKHDRHWNAMKSSVSQLQTLLVRPQEVCRWSPNIQPKVFLEAMKLASTISAEDWYETAEMLYLVTVPKIHALDNFIYGRKKADAFIAYCMQHRRRKEWRKCIRDILHAYKCLMAGDRESAVQEGPVDLLRETWSVIKKAIVDEPGVTKDAATRESMRKIDLADQKLLCWKKLLLSGLLDDESEEEDWDKDATARDSRYGVTYSVSDVTGVSYSAYYRELR
ncbi:uncharacterized protein L3040_005222 [Drepanopeziza brunnea f. sp. 'multigermtubi']|uniref:uncharacterized protein n=1 Tax=Drepanopeziza brunnea f. sp. 'multigermtubi' TaxID=698441 RepID=UPI00239D14B4|nr:hypothetical protein L3040_005222 [Drepanopeziza brunnea f. sp. 'multigermtubi']